VNKKNFFTLSFISIFLTTQAIWQDCYARKFKFAGQDSPCDGDTKECGPFWRSVEKDRSSKDANACAEPCHKKLSSMPRPEVSLDWTQTTTKNLESAVEYFFSIIPEEQDDLRKSLKQKEIKTRDKIKKSKLIGDQNYKEAEFLASKLAMVANWHKAAQDGLLAALQEQDDAIGGVKYKEFQKTQRDAQKELLYEIYAMLDGACPDPNKPVDQNKLDEKVHEVVTELFAELRKTSDKSQPKVPTPQKPHEVQKAAEPVLEREPRKNPKQQELEKLNQEILAAKLKEELEHAKRMLDKYKADNLELKQDLETERKKRTEENIRQKIDEKRFQDSKTKLEKDFQDSKSKLEKDFQESKSKLEQDFQDSKTKLEKEKSDLESKMADLDKKKTKLECRIDSLEEEVRKEATGKTLTSIELEKMKKQKESAEVKLQKKKTQIAELKARLQENDRKQVDLQIEIAKIEKAKAIERQKAVKLNANQATPKTPLSKNTATVSDSASTTPRQKISAGNLGTDKSETEKNVKKLDELNSQEINQTKGQTIKDVESLFADFTK
jgi:hypothetical protein